MLHNIEPDSVGPRGQPMADAVTACVHCGFCLPACPTYETMGEEMDSPRGRIFLMKETLEQHLPLDDALPYIDRCLGCLACEPACPSGVEYRNLITSFRAYAEPRRQRSMVDRVMRKAVLSTLPFPRRMRLAVRLGQLIRPIRWALPKRLENMADLLPTRIPRAIALPEVSPAVGTRRGRVALLAGCAQQVLAPEINRAAVDVLTRNGVEVIVPRQQVCCGALAAHTGALDQAVRFAKRNLAAFPPDVDAVVTTAAGCGSGMHEYPLWLAGEDEQQEASRLAESVIDICEYLESLGCRHPNPLPQPLTVAYQDACHLRHGQGVAAAPRQLLARIGNLNLATPASPDRCCGSAGTYNLEQPATAAMLGAAKVQELLATEADVIVSGNIGCLMQIRTHLRAAGATAPAIHTVELLARAYG